MLRAVALWWWLGAIPVIVVLAHLTLTYRSPAPAYQVVLRFTTGGMPAASLSPDYDRYYAWLSSEYVANGLADLAMTGTFADKVAQRLAQDGLAVSASAIHGAIVTDNAQSILVVYLTWPDANQASVIAGVIGETLVALGPSYYPQMDGLGAVAQLADPPAPVAVAPGLRTQLLGPAVRILVGASFGAALIYAASVLDPTVREPNDLAEAGMRVVGELPTYRTDRPRSPASQAKRPGRF
jgi:hypothetical protein